MAQEQAHGETATPVTARIGEPGRSDQLCRCPGWGSCWTMLSRNSSAAAAVDRRQASRIASKPPRGGGPASMAWAIGSRTARCRLSRSMSARSVTPQVSVNRDQYRGCCLLIADLPCSADGLAPVRLAHLLAVELLESRERPGAVDGGGTPVHEESDADRLGCFLRAGAV